MNLAAGAAGDLFMVLRVGASGTTSRLIQNNARANRFVDRATQRLSTGLRINQASDDPSGLVAAEKLRGDLVDLAAQSRVNNAKRGQHRIAQGGLRAASSVLQEMRGLAMQAIGDTSSREEKNAIQQQMDSSLNALELLAADGGTTVPAELLSLRSGGAANVVSGDVTEALDVIERALEDNTASRVAAGVYEKYTLDVDRRLAEAQAVATASSLSSIADADFAQESSNLIVGGILAKASISTLALSYRIQSEQARAVFDQLF